MAPRRDARWLRRALVCAFAAASALVPRAGSADDTPRFEILDAQGTPIDDGARAAQDGYCVHDTTSGLTWERKRDDGGLRDRRWTYTPYDGNPATNGGYAGYRDSTSGRCARTLLRDRSCNTEAYVEAVNRSGLCGHADWRLPTYAELAAMAVETSALAASTTPHALPGIEEGWYWTAVGTVGPASFARVVLLPPRARPQFYDGSYLVMVVRGGR